MNEIEKKALDTYKKNLHYLKNKHPLLYSKIIKLEDSFNLDPNLEEYILEYKNEGYFDAYSKTTQTYLYNMDSVAYAQSLVEIMTPDKQGSIFEGQRYLQYEPLAENFLDAQPLTFKNGYWGAVKPLYYCFKHANKQSTSMKIVPKSIFLDIRLGTHIEPIIKKLHSKYIFLYEKNLETFRLSLFVTPYSEISNHCKIYFSVQDSQDEIKNNFLPFVSIDNFYNLYMKHITLTKDYFEDLQTLQRYTFEQDHLQYSYATLLLNYTDAPYYLINNYHYLDVSYTYKTSLFSEKPILLLFSGPSTARNIEFLKQFSDKFIIISTLSTCRLLHKYSIVPDIIVQLDPQDTAIFKTINEIDKSYFNNCLFICSSNIHKNIAEYFIKDNIFIIASMEGFKHGYGSITAPNAGTFAYAIMLLFGAKNMYMLGIDMALDSETLQTHSKHHNFSKVGETNTDIVANKITYIKGNFKELVPSIPTYIRSLQQFELFNSALKNENQKIFNLSDGAYIDQSISLDINDANLSKFANINKSQLQKEIKSFFISSGSCSFSTEDKKLIIYQINKAKQILKLIKRNKSISFVSSEKYLESLLKLVTDIIATSKHDQLIVRVFTYYFKITLSYAFDLFNTNELSDEKEHIKDFQNIYSNEMEKITKYFIEKMEGYLN